VDLGSSSWARRGSGRRLRHRASNRDNRRRARERGDGRWVRRHANDRDGPCHATEHGWPPGCRSRRPGLPSVSHQSARHTPVTSRRPGCRQPPNAGPHTRADTHRRRPVTNIAPDNGKLVTEPLRSASADSRVLPAVPPALGPVPSPSRHRPLRSLSGKRIPVQFVHSDRTPHRGQLDRLSPARFVQLPSPRLITTVHLDPRLVLRRERRLP